MSSWVGPAIGAAASLLGGILSNRAQEKAQDKAEKERQERLIQELELEKFRILNQKGGGGGRDRELAMLEAALGVSNSYANRQTQSLNSAANRYAQIYGSAG